jgi:hypothetical protein
LSVYGNADRPRGSSCAEAGAHPSVDRPRHVRLASDDRHRQTAPWTGRTVSVLSEGGRPAARWSTAPHSGAARTGGTVLR